MKARFVLYCIVFVCILIAALIVEIVPLAAVTLIIIAGIVERIAEHVHPRSPG